MEIDDDDERGTDEEGGGEKKDVSDEEKMWCALWVTASYVERQWGNVEFLLVAEGWDIDVDAMVTVGERWRVRVKGDGGEDSEESEDGSEYESESEYE